MENYFDIKSHNKHYLDKEDEVMKDFFCQKNSGRAKILDIKDERGLLLASDLLVKLTAIKYLLYDDNIKAEVKEGLYGGLKFMLGRFNEMRSEGRKTLEDNIYFKREKLLADVKKEKVKLLETNVPYMLNMFLLCLAPDTNIGLEEKIPILDNNSTKAIIAGIVGKLKKYTEESCNDQDFRNKIIMENVNQTFDPEKQIKNIIEFLSTEVGQCENLIKKIEEINEEVIGKEFPQEFYDKLKKMIEELSKPLEGFDYTKVIKSDKELIEKLEKMLAESNDKTNEEQKEIETKETEKKTEVKKEDKKEEKKEENKNTKSKKTKEKTEDKKEEKKKEERKKTEEKKEENKNTKSKKTKEKTEDKKEIEEKGIKYGVSDDFLIRMIRRRKRGGGIGQ